MVSEAVLSGQNAKKVIVECAVCGYRWSLQGRVNQGLAHFVAPRISRWRTVSKETYWKDGRKFKVLDGMCVWLVNIYADIFCIHKLCCVSVEFRMGW